MLRILLPPDVALGCRDAERVHEHAHELEPGSGRVCPRTNSNKGVKLKSKKGRAASRVGNVTRRQECAPGHGYLSQAQVRSLAFRSFSPFSLLSSRSPRQHLASTRPRPLGPVSAQSTGPTQRRPSPSFPPNSHPTQVRLDADPLQCARRVQSSVRFIHPAS